MTRNKQQRNRPSRFNTPVWDSPLSSGGPFNNFYGGGPSNNFYGGGPSNNFGRFNSVPFAYNPNPNPVPSFNSPLPSYAAPSQSPFQINSSGPLTPKQEAFECEFKKWEKSFQDWKDSYGNHPDRQAYYQYEQKFLEVREKLLKKRAEVYAASSLKPTLELQLSAASSMADSILSKFDDPPMGSRGNFGSGGMNRGEYRSRSPMNRNSGSYFDQNFMGGGQDFRGQQQNRRSGGNFPDRRSGGNNDRFDDRRGPGGNNDRRMSGGGNNNSGNSRNNRNKIDRKGPGGKPLPANKVYPNNAWTPTKNQEKPPLIGKRRKNKNAKITKFLENKAKLASGTTTEGLVGNDPEKKQLSQVEKWAKLLEEAKAAELPLRMSGAARRRYTNLINKSPTEWSEMDKKLMEYAMYIVSKRDQYFKALKAKTEAEAKAKEAEAQAETGEIEKTEEKSDGDGVTAVDEKMDVATEEKVEPVSDPAKDELNAITETAQEAKSE